jgi:hypothetical protein
MQQKLNCTCHINMKRISIILAFSIALLSCKKEISKDCFTVKYIDGTCATNIYQIQDANFEYLGEDNWVAAKDNKVYNNVFTQENYCDNITLNSDSTAKIYISTDKINYNCVYCLALYPKPTPKKLQVKQCK